jgi:hypothetical protein
MKRSFTGILALLGGAFAIHAQGTLSFANYETGFAYLYVAYKPATGSPQLLGGSTLGPTPTLSNYGFLTGNGNDWTVQLYAAAGANDSPFALSPLAGAIATFATGVPDDLPGTWFSYSVVDIPGTTLAGQFATVQLYAWYNGGGEITTFSQAVADDVPAGFSSTANVAVGGPNLIGPPNIPARLPISALGNFVVETPEPSTIVLGVIGASVFLMRLRRTN